MRRCASVTLSLSPLDSVVRPSDAVADASTAAGRLAAAAADSAGVPAACSTADVCCCTGATATAVAGPAGAAAAAAAAVVSAGEDAAADSLPLLMLLRRCLQVRAVCNEHAQSQRRINNRDAYKSEQSAISMHSHSDTSVIAVSE